MRDNAVKEKQATPSKVQECTEKNMKIKTSKFEKTA